jgi:hypothetical protein
MGEAIRARGGQGSCLDFNVAWFYIRPDWSRPMSGSACDL